MRIDHDQVFKQLIETFFREFMELFCPVEAEQIDFQQVEFLRDEFFTDSKRGQRKRLDLLAKVRLKVGGEKVVLVHFEFESTHNDTDFPERNFGYFCQIFLRYQTNVVSVAVFSDDAVWKEPVPNYFEMRMSPQSGVRFDFHLIKLKQLNYKDFLNSNNPLAYALMAKMSYDHRQRVRLKADFLRLMLGAEPNAARRSVLFEFIETYMVLKPNEQAAFDEIVQVDESYEEVEKMVTVYERTGIERGKRLALIRILTKRFGSLSEQIVAAIERIESEAELDALLDAALDAKSLAELSL